MYEMLLKRLGIDIDELKELGERIVVIGKEVEEATADARALNRLCGGGYDAIEDVGEGVILAFLKEYIYETR